MVILEILGVIFLILLLVAAYYCWKIYGFFKKVKYGHDDLSKVLSVLPDMEMDLQVSDLTEWGLRDQLIEQENTLRKLGLKHQGYHVLHSTLSTVQISIWNYRNAIVFVLYEAVPDEDVSQASFSFECVGSLNNGGSVCVSNSSFADFLPRPPEDVLLKVDMQEPMKMMQTLKASVPKGCKLMPIKNSKNFMMVCVERGNEWVWREEQLRSEKIQRALEPLGIDMNDELIAELVEHGKTSRSLLRSEQILRKIAQNPKISAAQWEEMRDKLVVVHEDMDVDSLVGAIYEMCVGLSESQENTLDALSESEKLGAPMEEFEKLKQQLGSVVKGRRIAQVSQPVQGEVYLMDALN